MKLDMRSALRGGVVAASAAVLIATNAVSAGAQPGVRNIRYGDSGNGVHCVQMALNLWGRAHDGWTGRISEDAPFGEETRGALLNFQRQNNLSADAVVGPRTGNILYYNYLKPAGYAWCYYQVPTA